MKVPYHPIKDEDDCGACNGTGYQTKNNGITIRCPVCRGNGKDKGGLGTDDLGPNIFQQEKIGDRDCMVEKFFENNPEADHAAISCPCPKCSPRI